MGNRAQPPNPNSPNERILNNRSPLSAWQLQMRYDAEFYRFIKGIFTPILRLPEENPVEINEDKAPMSPLSLARWENALEEEYQQVSDRGDRLVKQLLEYEENRLGIEAIEAHYRRSVEEVERKEREFERRRGNR